MSGIISCCCPFVKKQTSGPSALDPLITEDKPEGYSASPTTAPATPLRQRDTMSPAPATPESPFTHPDRRAADRARAREILDDDE